MLSTSPNAGGPAAAWASFASSSSAAIDGSPPASLRARVSVSTAPWGSPLRKSASPRSWCAPALPGSSSIATRISASTSS